MNNEVGKRIKALREKKGYTQYYMAKHLGLTQSNYGRLEKNDNRIDIIRLFEIVRLLETTTTWLLSGLGNESGLPKHINIIETPEKTIITVNK